MIYIILLIKLEKPRENIYLNTKYNKESAYKESSRILNFRWIINLFPLLSITLFITGVMTLLQIFLPLDLANGGIIRKALVEEEVATFITLKLFLIAIFQWPVGYIIRNKNSSDKFELCLISLLIGFIFLSISNFLLNGYILIVIAFIPITIALCIFLPSASDSIIKSSPIKYRGSAIALYSQCFGVSALIIPWIAGKLIDTNNTAFQVWLIISLVCIFLIPICKIIK